MLVARAPALNPAIAIRIDYVPRPGLLRMVFANFLLTVLTLTFYRFWAKTRVRRHLWSCVEINGEPLEYTGRGIELFKGALFVLATIGLPVIALIAGLSLLLGYDNTMVTGLQTLLIPAAFFLWGAAHYRARRYRLSRTLWRGIRASLGGSSINYTLAYCGSTLARFLTLGWATPVLNFALQQQMTNAASFGNLPFRFKGRARPLYGAYAISWVLFIVGAAVLFWCVTLVLDIALATQLGQLLNYLFFGLRSGSVEQKLPMIILSLVAVPGIFFFTIYPAIWSFYTARELAVFASYTSLGNAQFKFDASAASIIALGLGNFLIWALTLGIGKPFIQQRMLRFLCAKLTVLGTLDIEAIKQSRAPIPSKGEGLADIFKIGWL
jgi:uncharacterized membrane protein YjgN (DUF898 family)